MSLNIMSRGKNPVFNNVEAFFRVPQFAPEISWRSLRARDWAAWRMCKNTGPERSSGLAGSMV